MSCVYRYVDEYDKIQYVGRTTDLDSRHLHHINPSDENYLILRDCSIEFIGGLSVAESDMLETYFISIYRPPLNKAKTGWGGSSVQPAYIPQWEPVHFPEKTRKAIEAINRTRPKCRRCGKMITYRDAEYEREYAGEDMFCIDGLCADCGTVEWFREVWIKDGSTKELNEILAEDRRLGWQPEFNKKTKAKEAGT